MQSVGIICEYNPFHNGHLRQLRLARERTGEDCALVCLMSGSYVQRGEPALFPKALRAEAALACGADLVLELPLTVALSSAEGFAAGGVRLLTALGCDGLCFGMESETLDRLMTTARANLDPAFDGLVRRELSSGCSYPAARQRALEALGAGEGLTAPNDILAVEYCKALLAQGSPMKPLALRRPDTYHSQSLDPQAPSATALRGALTQARQGEGADWKAAVPACLHALYAQAPRHTWQAGERAALAILRTLPAEAYRALPFGSEGLWSKLMTCARTQPTVEAILEAAKSKRYTRSRLQRMLLCAVLGLTAPHLDRDPPYLRVLGFNDRGRAALREMKPRFPLVNAGQRPAGPQAEAYFTLETRAADLYSLFSAEGPRPAGEEDRLRVSYLPK